MNKNTVVSLQDREQIADSLTQMLRAGAHKLIEQAIEAELQELLSQYAGEKTDSGHAVVVRNGYLPQRAIQTGIGPVTVKVPKVRSRSGDPVTFRSALVPPLRLRCFIALSVILSRNARNELANSRRVWLTCSVSRDSCSRSEQATMVHNDRALFSIRQASCAGIR